MASARVTVAARFCETKPAALYRRLTTRRSTIATTMMLMTMICKGRRRERTSSSSTPQSHRSGSFGSGGAGPTGVGIDQVYGVRIGGTATRSAVGPPRNSVDKEARTKRFATSAEPKIRPLRRPANVLTTIPRLLTCKGYAAGQEAAPTTWSA